MLVPSLLKQKRDAGKSCHSTTVTGKSRKDLKLERLVFQRHRSNPLPFRHLTSQTASAPPPQNSNHKPDLRSNL